MGIREVDAGMYRQDHLWQDAQAYHAPVEKEAGFCAQGSSPFRVKTGGRKG